MPERDAERVMDALNGVRYKGREVRCNDADEGGHGAAARSGRGSGRDFGRGERGSGRGERAGGRGERAGRKATRSRRSDRAPRDNEAARDDWKALIQGQSVKLKGEEPDFSEEGWARRFPKKKK